MINEHQQKRDRDWSLLSGQVVDAETVFEAAPASPEAKEPTSALIARQVKRIDELETACLRAVNYIDNADSGHARDVLLVAMNAPKDKLSYPERTHGT